jgi:hypothetical protein
MRVLVSEPTHERCIVAWLQDPKRVSAEQAAGLVFLDGSLWWLHVK